MSKFEYSTIVEREQETFHEVIYALIKKQNPKGSGKVRDEDVILEEENDD